MLRLGEQNINGLYLGEQEIKKAYLGENLVFSAEKPSRLPEGYTEVRYISNPNLGVIYPAMSDKNPFNNHRIEISMELNATDVAGSIFGSYYYYWYASTGRRSCNNRLYYEASTTEIKLLLGYYSSSVGVKYYHAIPAPSGQMNIIVDLPKSLFQVNDETVVTQVTKNDTNYTYTPALFGEYTSFYRKNSANASNVTQYARPTSPLNFKLYGFKVYQSTDTDTGDKIVDFAPCIAPDGKVGVYDLIGDTFIGNTAVTGLGDGFFEAGPAV